MNLRSKFLVLRCVISYTSHDVFCPVSKHTLAEDIYRKPEKERYENENKTHEWGNTYAFYARLF